MNLLGSLDIDCNPALETKFFVAILHEYEDADCGEQVESLTVESTDSIAERDTVRSGSPGSDSSGTGTERAATERTAEPHAPRKLHNCTRKVYTEPGETRRPGTVRGGGDSNTYGPRVQRQERLQCSNMQAAWRAFHRDSR